MGSTGVCHWGCWADPHPDAQAPSPLGNKRREASMTSLSAALSRGTVFRHGAAGPDSGRPCPQHLTQAQQRARWLGPQGQGQVLREAIQPQTSQGWAQAPASGWETDANIPWTDSGHAAPVSCFCPAGSLQAESLPTMPMHHPSVCGPAVQVGPASFSVLSLTRPK